MNFGARLLGNVSDINHFEFITQVEVFEGTPFDVYIQLIDKDQLPLTKGWEPAGLRYMPVVGATMLIQFQNIDSNKKFNRAAVQPFAQDPSIWKVSLLATDPIRGTVSIRITLTESANQKIAVLQAAILAATDGSDC